MSRIVDRFMQSFLDGGEQGSMSRTDYGAFLDDGSDADWSYTQSTFDESSVRWNVKTDLDGKMSGLYIQVPYGYRDDLLRNPDSVVLKSISNSMRKAGHDDWADLVDGDVISDAAIRSGSCQTIAFSYNESYRIDQDYMKALSIRDPYNIEVLNPDLMTEYAGDESPDGRNAADHAKSFSKMAALMAILTALISLSSPGLYWLFLIPAGALGASIGSMIVSRAQKRKWDRRELRRPGYILELKTGWLIWQYDGGGATPAKLADSAMTAVRKYIGSHHQDDDVDVGQEYSSDDGRMVFVKSSKPLESACAMTPYEAEKYLSLFVAHQQHQLNARKYPAGGPTIIRSTVGIGERSGSSSTSSPWSSESALKRAESTDVRSDTMRRIDAVAELARKTNKELEGHEETDMVKYLRNLDDMVLSFSSIDMDSLGQADLMRIRDVVDSCADRMRSSMESIRKEDVGKRQAVNPFLED